MVVEGDGTEPLRRNKVAVGTPAQGKTKGKSWEGGSAVSSRNWDVLQSQTEVLERTRWSPEVGTWKQPGKAERTGDSRQGSSRH